MHYYLYQITNLVNNKIYVGVHKTKDLNDGYMGSGKVIKRAIEKHGIDNFVKVILETFENAEAMYAREKEVVTEEFLAREDVYNLRRGGHGGFEYIHRMDLGNNRSLVASTKGGIKSRDMQVGFHSTNSKTKAKIIQKENKAGYFYNEDLRKKGCIAAQSDEARQKRIETLRQICHQQGTKNSNYGKCWISHKSHGSKMCAETLLPTYLDEGWIKGRNKFK